MNLLLLTMKNTQHNKHKEKHMKNILFSLLILSSSFIYCDQIKVNIQKREPLQSSYKKKSTPSRYLPEEDIDFDDEEYNHLHDAVGNQDGSSSG